MIAGRASESGGEPRRSGRAGLASPRTALDVTTLRADFPILSAGDAASGKPLIYLDTAASAQKPRAVLDALSEFYAHEYANIHRGIYGLSTRATSRFEGVRARVAQFLNAAEPREIVFVHGTTEAVNLVASSWGDSAVGVGDEIVISALEHHSNIVPWQLLCERRKARLRVIPIDEHGDLDLDAYEKLLNDRTRLVAVTQLSNALGTVTPLAHIIERAHARGAVVLVDGAQAAPHLAVDVQALDCDFYVCSSHKLYGPTGAGILYGKARLLEAMPPWQGGGEMIRSVTFERTTYNDIPWKFEAGTPAIAQVIGLGAALEYIDGIGRENIAAHEDALLAYALEVLAEVPGVRIHGTQRRRAALVSFSCEGMHPHDVGTVLDQEGIAVRAGHHCAQPLMEILGVPATVRASFGLYNTREDIDALRAALDVAEEILG